MRTTVATNALILGNGAATGMITTAGFRDVLELRRQKRDLLYDLQKNRLFWRDVIGGWKYVSACCSTVTFCSP